MSRLYDKWFTPTEKEMAEDSQKDRALMEQKINFVSQPYFKVLHRKIREMADGYEVLPGKHEEMLYSTGCRAGLLASLRYLDQLVKEVEENV